MDDRRRRSGCASPASARSGRSPLPRPGPGRGARAHAALRGQPRHRVAGLQRRVPASQYAVMRAPFQEGDFPGPVKYGYLSVGVVEEGPAALRGRTVFCLYPHQTAYVVPADAVTVVPDGVPRGARRARRHRRDRRERPVGRRPAASATGSRSSAPAWSAAASPGCSRGCPGVEVTLVDVDPARRRVAAALGVDVRRARRRAPGGRDLVVHTSATSAGLQLLARPARAGGRGARAQLVRRRGDHACRSAARSTPAGWRSGRARSARSPRPAAGAGPPRERLALALDLLRDPAYDVLLTGESRVRGAARR